MLRGRRVLAILIIGVLSLGPIMPIHATEIEEKKQEGEDLKAKKELAQEEKTELDNRLQEVMADMRETEEAIEKKHNEIELAENNLVNAQIKADDQYEDMKKRIQFMYENGQVQMLDIICSAQSMSDLINKAEYVTQISEADREMLDDFKETIVQIQEHEATLREEEEALNVVQDQLIDQQVQVEELLASKDMEIQDLESAIGENAAELEELIKAAEEAKKRREEALKAAAAAAAGYGSAGSPVISGNGQFAHPCPNGRITSGFGYRVAPTAGATSYHGAIDYGAPTGSPVYAADSGTVVTSHLSATAGNFIVINHGNGMQTLYMHMSARYVSVGQSVSKGDNIGAVGSTGISTGPHLHFEVKVNGVSVNPLNFL